MVEQIKPDGSKKYRRILNCVPLNLYIPQRKFSLPTAEMAAKLISGQMISIDLKSAYFQKGLAFEDMPHFCFKIWSGKCWQYFAYNSIPFGLSSAPFIFQIFFSRVSKILEKFSISLLYLDDLILEIPQCIQGNKEEVKKYIEFVIQLLAILGLIINDKCHLSPCFEITWLGKEVNSFYNTTFPCYEKISRHMSEFFNFMIRGRASFQDLASLRGKLQFLTENHFSYVFQEIDSFFSNNLGSEESQKLLQDPINCKEKYKEVISLPVSFWEVFLDLQNIILDLLSPRVIDKSREQIKFFSDASELAGGYFWCFKDFRSDEFSTSLEGLNSSELPAPFQVNKSIPQSYHPSSLLREAFVMLEGLEELCVSLLDTPAQIECFCDNLGLISNLKKGKSVYPQTQIFIKQILELQQKFPHLDFRFTWTRRSATLLQVADDLSKCFDISFTAEASNKIFQWIERRSHLNKSKEGEFFRPWSLAESLQLQVWSPRRW